MSIVFFDTCSLVLRYDTRASSRRVRRLISDSRNTVYIADTTVLELASSLATECRRKGADAKVFDRMTQKFFADLADETLSVRSTTKREVLRAYDLIRWVGVHKRRNLKSSDALIATCCYDLAMELKEKIAFYTSDRRLHDVLHDTDLFESALNIRYIDPGYKKITAIA